MAELHLQTLLYETTDRIARITLNRPKRGNGITLDMARELADVVERANLDPAVHVIALAGNGPGFCGGYDLAASAESLSGYDPDDATGATGATVPPGSPLDPMVMAGNHDPSRPWDPVTDYQMMTRNVRGFMSLFHSEKPVLLKAHGFCVAGGTDLALCADLLVVDDDAKIGYPPARVWGSPTSALWATRLGVARAKRLLFTGDCLSGREAYEWGLATESVPRDQLDERFETLVQRIARVPINQLVMQKLLVNQALYAQGLHATQVLGTFFDGVARHTAEGYAFQRRAAEQGWREAVRQRDEPFGDLGASTFKG
ncbi:crotonase/enoyl-CoA hydratase family protein [Actinocorallia sp. API 0066]|uniref:crotonase/enoyl-CoA hydratase family protein n=1 Tax=Actinocorallia sp. API 0066 TaxID=2896846 RepID=UPI001E3780FA|nr:crotonase/enoyl-CoA hydratase family protein [Actinocorallia sp. API 0066]MCD0448225.1 crotonase/enoyl-CoA hydratase family protein [Actinocorallia sp. API 0066]